MQPQMSSAYELSPQQKLLFNRGLEKNACGIALELDDVDPAKVKRVLGQLVERHEILRTHFQRRTGMKFPFQVVRQDSDISWSDADLAGLSAAEQRAKIAELLGDKSKINIESGPVFHATLATLDAHRTVLALTCSAFIVDLKSLDNLGEEFLSLYSGASLAEEVLQYADFSEW